MEELDKDVAYWCYLVGRALLKWDEIHIRLGHSSIASSFRYTHYPKDMPEDFKLAMEYVKKLIDQEHKHWGEKLKED